MSYAPFAPFYDSVTGPATQRLDYVRRCIQQYAPDARSVLELGCGTGLLLSELTDLPVRVGIDLSPEMLDLARTRDTKVEWRLGDITQLSLSSTFDVVLCMYDTVNHLTEPAAWPTLCERAAAHLAPGGLFVFDVNTIKRLLDLSRGPAFVSEFDRGVLIMQVTCLHDAAPVQTSWRIRVFAQDGAADDSYRLHETTVGEAAMPLEWLIEQTASWFDLLETDDGQGGAATEQSDRAYFAVRRR